MLTVLQWKNHSWKWLQAHKSLCMSMALCHGGCSKTKLLGQNACMHHHSLVYEKSWLINNYWELDKYMKACLWCSLHQLNYVHCLHLNHACRMYCIIQITFYSVLFWNLTCTESHVVHCRPALILRRNYRMPVESAAAVIYCNGGLEYTMMAALINILWY